MFFHTDSRLVRIIVEGLLVCLFVCFFFINFSVRDKVQHFVICSIYSCVVYSGSARLRPPPLIPRPVHSLCIYIFPLFTEQTTLDGERSDSIYSDDFPGGDGDA